MTFDELCKDFEARRPRGNPISSSPFFNAKWENGSDSVNDLLRRGLRELGYEHINTFNGDVWFLYHGIWECCEYEIKDRDGSKWVHFYLCKF